MNLELYKYVYFIGIGGIGMSALARYFNAKGKYVVGYDQINSDLSIALESEGIIISYLDKVSSIPNVIQNAKYNDILVIYTPAITEKNQIFSFFKDKKYKVFKRAEILGLISKQLFTIAVAGTHGKTTTSTMLAHILKKSGKETTAFLGGISRNYNTNLLMAERGDILIVEADEYDRSFLQIFPDIAIITSVSADHLDIYEDEEDLNLAFIQFASQVKEKGLLLFEESIDIDFPVPDVGVRFCYSAKNRADYFSENIRVQNGKMIFDMIALEKKQSNIMLDMPGTHNISNAVAATAIAFYLGLSFDAVASGLKTFKGVNRRFDKHIDTDKMVYIDDYAHHPEEVSATIVATKQLYPKRELIVVFQPHLFSRTKDFANEFAVSLEEADDLVLLDIYPAREKPIVGVSSQMILDLCSNSNKEVCSKDQLLSVLEKKNIDILLTLGAGDISTLVQPIKHMLN
ncbi:MAG: UDP-N-acetylmuramate--L-alanine ligase [Flavobacteriales bacterium]|nr:UDP-N-acetylmuramate--L-alanine ligase [Flavobacteriales bacterium]